jgi:hypothetical protein
MLDKIPRFLAALAACLLASCIEGHEEVWIHADGSGRAEVTYLIPAKAAVARGGPDGFRQSIEKELAVIDGFRETKVEVTRQDERLRIFVSLAFDSALALRELTTAEGASALSPAARHFSGETDIRFKGLNVEVTRTMSPGKALPGAGFLPASNWQGRQLRYTMHLPQAVLASNATRVENHGRTLVWEIPLADAIAAPVVTRFETRVPIPWWAYAVLAGAVTVPLGWWLRRRMARASSPAAGGLISRESHPFI